MRKSTRVANFDIGDTTLGVGLTGGTVLGGLAALDPRSRLRFGLKGAVQGFKQGGLGGVFDGAGQALNRRKKVLEKLESRNKLQATKQENAARAADPFNRPETAVEAGTTPSVRVSSKPAASTKPPAESAPKSQANKPVKAAPVTNSLEVDQKRLDAENLQRQDLYNPANVNEAFGDPELIQSLRASAPLPKNSSNVTSLNLPPQPNLPPVNNPQRSIVPEGQRGGSFEKQGTASAKSVPTGDDTQLDEFIAFGQQRLKALPLGSPERAMVEDEIADAVRQKARQGSRFSNNYIYKNLAVFSAGVCPSTDASDYAWELRKNLRVGSKTVR